VTTGFPEDDLSIRVTIFDFLNQCYSFITDKSLTGDITQLDVNPDDPFARYHPPNGRLSAFNSGIWYAKAHSKLCTEPNDWICAIISACDTTLVGSHLGRMPITPLVFMLSIFNESIRNKQTSWRPLGYVYDIAQHDKGMISTTTRNLTTKMKPEEKCSRQHQIVRKLIESHVEIQ
jgi:hypothetical protein